MRYMTGEGLKRAVEHPATYFQCTVVQSLQSLHYLHRGRKLWSTDNYILITP